MTYSVQLCTSDAVASFMMRQPSGNMGFPSTITYPWNMPFDYLIYSQWMCGPYDVVHGATGIGTLCAMFSFGIGGITLSDQSATVSTANFFTGSFDASPTHGVFSHMIMSVDTANRIVQLYINDAATPVTGSWVGSIGTNHLNVGYTGATSWGWNPTNTLISGNKPGVGDIWCAAPPHFIDLSVTANRRAFIHADLSPVDLGTSGVALGITPQMWFTVRPGGVPLDIVTNRGIGQSLSQVDPGLRFQAPGQCIMPTLPVSPSSLALDDIVAINTTPTIPLDTRIFLDWSDNRGRSYRIPVGQNIGKPGAYFTNLQWQRLGYARDRVFRLTWSAPVKTALQGAWIDLDAQAKT